MNRTDFITKGRGHIWHRSTFMFMCISFMLCISVILTSCSSRTVASDMQTGTENADESITPQTASEENPDIGGGGDSKIMVSHKIDTKFMSYYTDKRHVSVEAAMGDEYATHQRLNIMPSYDTFGENGYPIFCVELYEYNGERNVLENPLTVNGISGNFEKRFAKEDMPGLDISDYQDRSEHHFGPSFDDLRHRETVTLDFSHFKPGDYGIIKFLFGWFYYHDNPWNQTSLSYHGCFVEFYVSEEGINLIRG